MKCSNCKKEVDPSGKFCEFCGSGIVVESVDDVRPESVMPKEHSAGKTMDKKGIYLVLILCSVAFLFYWYEYRPSQIKKQCNESTVRESGDWEKDYDYIYKKCLHSRGL